MTKSIEEEYYDLFGQDPRFWLQQAKRLKMSAEVILYQFRAEFVKSRPLSPGSPEVMERKMALMQSIMMLMGFSFENLIKGVYIAQTPELSVDERLSRWRKHSSGHGIANLATDVTNLNANEEYLLKRLEIYIVWAGRYSTSTNVRQSVESYQPIEKSDPPKFLHSFFPNDDPILWDSLFSRLSTLLQNELIKQSTAGNETMHLTAVIQRDELPSGGEMFLATCPELDVVSQGETPDEARANLREAVEGLLQVADDAEIGRRLRNGASVEPLKVAA